VSNPHLVPWTAFGEVYQYTLENKNNSLMDVKTMQDWTLRYACAAWPE